MKSRLLIVLFCLFVQFSWAQTARVQFIHNCADALADTVDIYLGENILIDNLPFRSSTAFMNISAGQDIVLSVVPHEGGGVGDALAQFSFNLVIGEKYVIVANGIIDTENYSPASPFNLEAFAGARELALDLGGIDFNFFHGATDAPTIDIAENELLLLTAIEDLAYNSFSGYITLPAANYSFLVQNEDASVSYSVYSAPFASLGLNGKSITVMTSGFMSSTMNNNGPAFGLWASLAEGGPMVELATPKASLQVINNSADAAADVVDVYGNGILLANDLAFHFSTGEIRIPSAVPMDIAIAPGDSENASEAFFVMGDYVFDQDENYLAVANGIVSEIGYNPSPSFELQMIAGFKQTADDPSGVEILFVNGSTDVDSPTDIHETLELNTDVITGLAYPLASDYVAVPEANLHFTFDEPALTFVFPGTSLNLEGQVVVVLTSGFVYPNVNSQGQGFGLWMLAQGSNQLIPLNIVITPVLFTSAQFIHNSADAMAETIDIYADDLLLLNDFEFRSASPFIDVQINDPIEMAFAPANSDGPEDAFYTQEVTLSFEETYILMINGIISSGYNPAPDFGVTAYAGARESSITPGTTDFLLYNGCTDCPALDFHEITIPVADFEEDLGMNDFSDYHSMSGSENYGMTINNANGTVVFGEYALPFLNEDMEGASAVLFTSGFHYPVNNSNGPGFEFWMAFADGETMPLGNFVSVTEKVPDNVISISPNPVSDEMRLYVLHQLSGIAEIKILHPNGTLVKKQNISLNSSRTTIDTSELATGVYTLWFKAGDVSETVRFVVIR